MNNIGLAIKFFREKKFPGHGGQTQAAKLVGIGKAGWSKYENSERLSNATLRNISKALDVTVDDLITYAEKIGVENRTPPAPASGDEVNHDDLTNMDRIKRCSKDELLEAYAAVLARLTAQVPGVAAGHGDFEKVRNQVAFLAGATHKLQGLLQKSHTQQNAV